MSAPQCPICGAFIARSPDGAWRCRRCGTGGDLASVSEMYRTDPDLVDAIVALVDERDAHEPTRGDHTNGDPTSVRAPDTIADPPMERETTPWKL